MTSEGIPGIRPASGIAARLLLLLALPPSSGCMINTVRDIGNRTEEVSRYESAAQRGDELVILYTVRIKSYNHTPCHYSLYPSQSALAGEAPRWGIVNLDSGWTDLDEQLGTNWGKRELIATRDGTRLIIESR